MTAVAVELAPTYLMSHTGFSQRPWTLLLLVIFAPAQEVYPTAGIAFASQRFHQRRTKRPEFFFVVAPIEARSISLSLPVIQLRAALCAVSLIWRTETEISPMLSAMFIA